MLQFSYWEIVRNGMTFLGDILVLITFVSCCMVLLGALIAAGTGGRAPVWFDRWEAAILGLIFSWIGFASKVGDALPTGALFRLNIFVVGLILLLSVVFVVLAIALPSLARRSRG
jgi:hypothetical protein